VLEAIELFDFQVQVQIELIHIQFESVIEVAKNDRLLWQNSFFQLQLSAYFLIKVQILFKSAENFL